jgi:hypothetical protein
MAGVVDETDAVREAGEELYAVPPDDFMVKRTEIAKRLRAAGDATSAGRVEKLRKPTVAAWIVNALVLNDPSTVDRLTGLGDRLRDAQDKLDATALRDLTTERRALVGDLTKAAFRQADKRQPPAGLRDEVSGTFEAAIAEPEIADRLGRLQRAEQWSGFGFLPTSGPGLTLVRGGRDDDQPEKGTAAGKPPAKPPAKKVNPAERRRQERALAAAQKDFEAAESGWADARAAEQDLSQRVKKLARKLSKLQDELDATREALEGARKEVTAARGRRRDARNALDRAERAGRA